MELVVDRMAPRFSALPALGTSIREICDVSFWGGDLFINQFIYMFFYCGQWCSYLFWR